jgi:glycosyltransferase involved in cell wall biosynthesis
LIYPGALTYHSNLDAMVYFLRESWPIIQKQRPQVRLRITGRTDGVDLARLALTDQVVMTGYLDDIRSAVAQSWICVVPLRAGGGTRLKILESLALGTPVVSTSKGAEGLNLIPGRDILVADEPADFAEAVLNVLQDPVLRETLSRNGRQAVEAKYDWRIIGQQFDDFVETAVK